MRNEPPKERIPKPFANANEKFILHLIIVFSNNIYKKGVNFRLSIPYLNPILFLNECMRGVSSTFLDAVARERIAGMEQNYICATKQRRRCCWRPVSQTACEHAKNSDFLQTRNKRKRIDFLIPLTFPGSLGVNLSHHNASERWKSAHEALVGANLLFITKIA